MQARWLAVLCIILAFRITEGVSDSQDTILRDVVREGINEEPLDDEHGVLDVLPNVTSFDGYQAMMVHGYNIPHLERDMSITFWMYLPTTSAYQRSHMEKHVRNGEAHKPDYSRRYATLFRKPTNSCEVAPAMWLTPQLNRIRFSLNGAFVLDESTMMDSVNTLNPGAWNHVACVINDATMTLFINGVRDSVYQRTPSQFVLGHNMDALYVGWDPWSRRGFAGLMTEFRVYNYGLKRAAIKHEARLIPKPVSVAEPAPPAADEPVSVSEIQPAIRVPGAWLENTYYARDADYIERMANAQTSAQVALYEYALAQRALYGDDPEIESRGAGILQAITHFEAAAARGLPAAYFDLGVLHQYGVGVPADMEKALEYYGRAALAGHEGAQIVLGYNSLQRYNEVVKRKRTTNMGIELGEVSADPLTQKEVNKAIKSVRRAWDWYGQRLLMERSSAAWVANDSFFAEAPEVYAAVPFGGMNVNGMDPHVMARLGMFPEGDDDVADEGVNGGANGGGGAPAADGPVGGYVVDANDPAAAGLMGAGMGGGEHAHDDGEIVIEEGAVEEEEPVDMGMSMADDPTAGMTEEEKALWEQQQAYVPLNVSHCDVAAMYYGMAVNRARDMILQQASLIKRKSSTPMSSHVMEELWRVFFFELRLTPETFVNPPHVEQVKSEEELEYLQSLAFSEIGEEAAESQYSLGQHYYEHNDFEKAAEFLKHASDNENAPAKGMLALMLLREEIRPWDPTVTAVTLLEEAYELELEWAAAVLGDYYFDHDPPNYESALDWYVRAPSIVTALSRAGHIHEAGLGVDKDEQRAIQYYQQAAQLGDTEGNMRLGDYMRNYAGECKAMVWYYKFVAEFGQSDQSARMHDSLAAGYHAALDEDPISSLLYYYGVAAMGVEVAQRNAAWVLDYLVSDEMMAEIQSYRQKEGEAVNWQYIRKLESYALYHESYTQAETTDAPVLLRLGDYSYDGIGTEENRARAFRLYAEAAVSPYFSAEGVWNVAYMIENGVADIRVNVTAARDLYRLCALHDDAGFLGCGLSWIKASLVEHIVDADGQIDDISVFLVCLIIGLFTYIFFVRPTNF